MKNAILKTGRVFFVKGVRFEKDVAKQVDEDVLAYIEKHHADKFDVEDVEEQEGNTGKSHDTTGSDVPPVPENLDVPPVKPLVVTKDTFDGLEKKGHDEIDAVAHSLGLTAYSKSNLNREQKVDEIKDYWIELQKAK